MSNILPFASSCVQKPKGALLMSDKGYVDFTDYIDETYAKHSNRNGYYVEFIVNNATNKNVSLLRDSLKMISAVPYVDVDSGGRIKVYVHTENPGKAIEAGLLFGSLVDIKIENLETNEVMKI
jgi:dihydroxyacetone kinase-like predicted kinase